MVVSSNVLALKTKKTLQNTENLIVDADYAKSGLLKKAEDSSKAVLSVSKKKLVHINKLDKACKNAQDGISLIQIAEDGMCRIGKVAQRLRELLFLNNNGQNSEIADTIHADKFALLKLLQEIDEIVKTCHFNNQKLLDGSKTSFTIHLLASSLVTSKIEFGIGNLSSKSLGLHKLMNNDAGRLTAAIVNGAVNQIANERAKIGAVKNKFEYVIKGYVISIENLIASDAYIRNREIADEMIKLAAGFHLPDKTADILAQANQSPQNVLSLLQQFQ